MVTDVDVQAIADDLEQALLNLDLDDLNARAGRTSWGYVEPTEAAWELVEEAVAPHLHEMKRRIALPPRSRGGGRVSGDRVRPLSVPEPGDRRGDRVGE